MNTTCVKSFILTALVCGGGTAGANAAPVYQLDPVNVTATRTELTISKTPANMAVIEGDTIEKRHYQDMSQVLRDESNVYIGNYGTGVGYANSNGVYINGNNNIVWLVDGVKMNAAGQSSVPLTMLKNMGDIERVEVVKGAASALYGSNAVGGVINIITKGGEAGIHGGISASAGSYDMRQYRVHTSGSEEGWSWRATYQKDKMGDYKDAHGLKIPQSQDADTTSFMLSKAIDKNNTLRLYYDKYQSDEMYADSHKKLDQLKHGKVDTNSFKTVWQSHIGNSMDNRFSFMTSRYKTMYDGYPLNIKSSNVADQFTWRAGDHTVVTGFDWTQDKVVSQDNVKLTNTALFLQDEWAFAPGWKLTPGIRMDHHSSFGTHYSPHASLSKELTDATNVYVSYNSFFIAPTPYQLYSPDYGNSSLDPETGWTWEFGVNHQFNESTTGNIHFFTRHTNDKINFLYSAEFPNGKYFNTDSEKAWGWDASLRSYLTPELFARLGYTFTHVDSTPQRTENVDGYLPKHAVVLGLTYARDSYDVNLDVRGHIDRPGPKTATVLPQFFPKNTYWITDLSANWRIQKNVTLWGRVNNLFDVFYAEQSNARVYGGSPGDWWTAPGRNFQIGVDVKF